MRLVMSVPPLTRRCALAGVLTRHPLVGSSAHAEMRPRGSRPYKLRARFLRSRGDAPPTFDPRSHGGRVPPLTRRCARGRGQERLLARGSSAHAEMRRRRPCRRSSERGFLRSRGDAPLGQLRDSVSVTVPPLTRRCAHDRGGPRGGDGGSSAHAEMRPCRRRRSSSPPWFLRSRGDAPGSRRRRCSPRAVPPLTRRCAPARGRTSEVSGGSSAHAEMRPELSSMSYRYERFLRSRGDAPESERRFRRHIAVPPLTRRCARSRRVLARTHPGSSAHAEMRPSRRSRRRSSQRFLRSRGDAPIGDRMIFTRSGVPPLTRRCAEGLLVLDRCLEGSSAHAEMRRRTR